MRRFLPLVLCPTPPPVRLGLLAAATSIVVETVYPLEGVSVYLLSVGAVSILWGVGLGAAAAVVSVLLWDHFHTPHPGIFSLHLPDLLALGMFLGVALLAGSVGELAGSALETSRDEQRLLAEQQAALRRVATLVARGVSPTQLFAAVASEMGQILEAECTEIIRYGTDRASYTVVGSWTRSKPTLSRPIGSCWPVEIGLVALLRTGRPARLDFGRYSKVSPWLRVNGITSSVGCPIMVEGRQWGAMAALSTGAEPQPADTEERMQEFTELVATAIANTESRDELIASRARVVATADETRRRIERDLHDGTKQRLISLALNLHAAQAATPPELDELRTHLAHTAQGLTDAVTELQEISRGIHPAILSGGGIGPALETLARRSAVPVELTVNANQRLAEPIEVAAYYIVSEALTNATKHAHASVVHVKLHVQDAIVRLWVRDDGIGGADPGQGSGLTGLRDRLEALGGTIEIASPIGGGTSLTVTIPIYNDLLAAHQSAGSRHLAHIAN